MSVPAYIPFVIVFFRTTFAKMMFTINCTLSSGTSTDAEASASARMQHLVDEASRPLRSIVAGGLKGPVSSYAAAASAILDDGRDAFSRGNYRAAYVLLTRYLEFATQLLPKHAGYAEQHADARAAVEEEARCVRTDELPALRDELWTRILEDERRRRGASSNPSWWQ